MAQALLHMFNGHNQECSSDEPSNVPSTYIDDREVIATAMTAEASSIKPYRLQLKLVENENM